ncbi:hypothetical protein T492DRAFT_837123 [Pavlovales sp. CCMP2436]|nr:hypothetical protein T492DRAFT_837123 [Pavlovales sp. CCMP2436]
MGGTCSSVPGDGLLPRGEKSDAAAPRFVRKGSLWALLPRGEKSDAPRLAVAPTAALRAACNAARRASRIPDLDRGGGGRHVPLACNGPALPVSSLLQRVYLKDALVPTKAKPPPYEHERIKVEYLSKVFGENFFCGERDYDGFMTAAERKNVDGMFK